MSPTRWLAALLLLSTAGSATAEERYFLILFGSQRPKHQPKYSHSMGIFLHATRQEGGPNNWHLESRLISWMPATLDIRVGAMSPEPGVNLPYHDSIRWALATEQRVFVWGPYEIKRELHDRAAAQAARLEIGEVRYKALDAIPMSPQVNNCVHALSGIVGELRLLAPVLVWGEFASGMVLRRYAPWVIEPQVTHDWLLGALGLESYPLLRRPFPHAGSNRGQPVPTTIVP